MTAEICYFIYYSVQINGNQSKKYILNMLAIMFLETGSTKCKPVDNIGGFGYNCLALDILKFIMIVTHIF
jgi:hypothetical protein